MSRPPHKPAGLPAKLHAATDAAFAAAGLSRGRRSTYSDPAPLHSVAAPRTPKPSSSAPARRGTPGIVTIRDWKDYPWLVAGFSTRQGGQTSAYAAGGPPEQNLGYTPEDDPVTVAETRRRMVVAAAKSQKASRTPDLVTIRQCHSGIIRRVGSGVLPLSTTNGNALLRGDALFTADPNLLLGILTADCVPVLIADTRTHAVAAFHAGWRGTLARIVERGVGTLRQEFGSRPEDLIAAIGPAIGACCFAVGEEVRHEFESQFAYAPGLFSEV